MGAGNGKVYAFYTICGGLQDSAWHLFQQNPQHWGNAADMAEAFYYIPFAYNAQDIYDTSPFLEWGCPRDFNAYKILISTDSNFTDLVVEVENLPLESYQGPTVLELDTTYLLARASISLSKPLRAALKCVAETAVKGK